MSFRGNGLRKQITEAKGGPLELRRKREARKICLGGHLVTGTFMGGDSKGGRRGGSQ